MFERFTERARQIVVLAQDEARHNHNAGIDVCHLVGGMIREEEGLASRILESLGITIEEAREKYPKSGDEITVGQIPLSPQAHKALELALREALSLGHNYIGTEHILLGVVRGSGGVMNIDGEVVRNEVSRLLVGRTTKKEEQAVRRSLPQAEKEALASGVSLLNELLEHGFQVTLSAFGNMGRDGRVRKPRFRINVNNGDAIAHAEFMELVKSVDEAGWAVEFSQKHGLTFRPQSDPDLPLSAPPIVTSGTSATATVGTASSATSNWRGGGIQPR